MVTIYMAAGNGIATAESGGSIRLEMDGLPVQCVDADPHRPETVYCGTFGEGLWCSTDAGRTWRRVDTFPGAQVMAMAVSPTEDGVIWAGTEPSALYRSEDGGKTWEEMHALLGLPSAPTWSFPPRPWTSHVRWIAPDQQRADRLFVGIELGGVMRTLDGGRTWEDRKPNSQHDAHTLRTHPLDPDRVYEAAGGGYAESGDSGTTWTRYDEGLTRRYVWGLAVDPGDPDTIIVSAATGPRAAHTEGHGEAAIYRRTGTSPWQEISEGLPPAAGTRAYVLAANPAEAGVFYAATREGDVYRSGDAGLTWTRLDVNWPGMRASNVGGLVVTDM